MQYGPIQYWTQRKQIKKSRYFTQKLSLDINYWSRFVKYPPKLLLVVCLAFEILFTKIFHFFNMWAFVRTSTNFAHLASFQAIEFMDRLVPKTLDIFVCQTSENKAFFSAPVQSRRTRTRFDLIPSFHAFHWERLARASFLHLHVSPELFTTQSVERNESSSSENPLGK